MTLLAVLEEAVSYLDAAERLLERCAVARESDRSPGARPRAGKLTVTDARQGLRLRVAFTQLAGWLDGMSCESEQEELRADAFRLVQFYLLMITHAVDADFRPAVRQRIVVRSGTCCAADSLVKLRDRARTAA